jgi:hypothetical protein
MPDGSARSAAAAEANEVWMGGRIVRGLGDIRLEAEEWVWCCETGEALLARRKDNESLEFVEVELLLLPMG